MKVVLIGGAGFIGSALAQRLSRAGHEVVVVDSRPTDGAQPGSGSSTRFVAIDNPTRKHVLAEVLTGSDVCFHLASTTTPVSADADPRHDLSTNLMLSLDLIEAFAEFSRGRLVFLSSGGTIYGPDARVPTDEAVSCRPVGSYGVVKLAIEGYLRTAGSRCGIDYKVIRLSNPYGPSQSAGKAQGVIPIFMRRVLAGEPISIWGDGNVVRDFVYLDDVTDALARVAFGNGSASTYNIGSGEGTSLRRLIELIAAVAGRTPKVLYETATSPEVPISVLDCSLIERETGWIPSTSLEAGLTLTWRALAGE